MSTRWNKIVLLLALAVLPAAPAFPARVAVVPPENRTGDTNLDYLGDLVFNILVVELSRCRDLELCERGRADLVVREQRLSPQLLSDILPSAPVDRIVEGAFSTGSEGEKMVVELVVRRLDGLGDETASRREVDFFDPGSLLSAIREMVGELFILSPGGDEEAAGGEVGIAGKKVAVTGFNNYSPRTEYDPLQKGIIYLIEERLGRNDALEVLEREKLKEISREISLAGSLGGARPGLILPSADLLVSGCFTFIGGDFLLAARVIEVPSTRIAAVFSRRCPASGAAAAVREVAEEIGGSLSGGRAEGVPASGLYPATLEALLYYARGAELYDRGEYLPAIEYFNRAVAVDPGYTFGSYQAGRIYEENLGVPGRAAEAYRKVLAGGPDPALREKILLRLGMLSYRRLDDLEGAVGYFERFLEEFPSSAYRDAVLNALGDAYHRRREDEKALNIYHQALDKPGFNPLRGSLLVRAGQCLYRLEDYPGARDYFQRARDDHGGEIYSSEIGAQTVTVGEEAERYLSRLK